MPSYLGDYPGAATNRLEKFHRAIVSVTGQTFDDWELIVVSDGCEITNQEVDRWTTAKKNIRLINIDKKPLFSGKVRNAGIYFAGGEYIVYLDTDDFLGPDHLSIIDESLKLSENPKWGYFDDFLGTPENKFEHRICKIKLQYHCGTSNLVHRKDLGVWWHDESYFHDWIFISDLIETGVGVPLAPAQYMVCHFPDVCDI